MKFAAVSSGEAENQKATELAKVDVERVRAIALKEQASNPKDVMDDVADTDDAVEMKKLRLLDSLDFIKRKVREVAGAEEFIDAAFKLKVGQISEVYQGDNNTFLCRVVSRRAGFDRDGTFHGSSFAWKDGRFRVVDTRSPKQHIWKSYKPNACTVDELREDIRQATARGLLTAWVSSVGQLPPDAAKERYLLDNEQVNVDYFALTVREFLDEVVDDEGAIRSFYNDYKDDVASETGEYGYSLPRSVRVEYVLASPTDLKRDRNRFKAEPQEIREYYDEHKDEEFTNTGADVEDVGKYKPLSEVRSQVQKKVIDEKVKQHITKINTLYARVSKQALTTGDLMMEEFAGQKQYGFKYGKTGFFGWPQPSRKSLPYQLRREDSFVVATLGEQRHTTESWRKERRRISGMSPEKQAQLTSNKTLYSTPMGEDTKYFFRVIDTIGPKTYEYDELIKLAEMADNPGDRTPVYEHLKEEGYQQVQPADGRELTDEERRKNRKYREMVQRTIEECKVARRIRDRMKKDWRNQQAIELATEHLKRLRRIAARKTIENFAEANELEVKVTEPYAVGGELPEEINNIEGLAMPLDRAEPGTLVPVVMTEDASFLAMTDLAEEQPEKPDDEATEPEIMAVVRYVSFDAQTLNTDIEPTDEDLEDFLATNVEDYEDLLPKTGKATIDYLALKLDDVEKTVDVSDEEIKAFFEADEDGEFEGKEPADVKADIRETLAKEKAEEVADELMDTVRDEMEDLLPEADLAPLAADHEDLAMKAVEPDEFLLDESADVPEIGGVDGFEDAIRYPREGMVSEVLDTDDARYVFRVVEAEREKRPGQRKFDELDEDGAKTVRQDWKNDLKSKQPLRKAILLADYYLGKAMKDVAETEEITTSAIVRTMNTSWKDVSEGQPPHVLRKKTDEAKATLDKIMKMKPGEISEPVKIAGTTYDRTAKKSVPKDDYYILQMKEKQDKPHISVKHVLIGPNVVGKRTDALDKRKQLAKAVARDLRKAVAGGKTMQEALKDPAGRFREGTSKPKVVDTEFYPVDDKTAGPFIGDKSDAFKAALTKLEEEGDLTPVMDAGDRGWAVGELTGTGTMPVAQVDLVRITPESLGIQNAAVPDEAAREYYDAHKEDFREGASLTVECIYETVKGYRSKVEVTEEEIKEHYEKHKATRWKARRQPEYKPFDEVKDEVKLDLQRRLAEPELLATVDVTDEQIKEYYDKNKQLYWRKQGGEQGFKPLADVKDDVTLRLRREVAGPEVLAKVEVTDEQVENHYDRNKQRLWKKPIPEDAPDFRPFDEVRSEVKRSLQLSRAKEDLVAKIDEVREKLIENRLTSEALAERYGLEFKAERDVTEEALESSSRFGRRSSSHETLSGLKNAWDKLADLKEGDVTEVLKGGSKYVVGRITEKSEAQIPEFDEVKSQAQAGAAKKLARERVAGTAAEYREKLVKLAAEADETKSIVDLAGENPLRIDKPLALTSKSSGFFRRRRPSYRQRGTYQPARVPGVGVNPAFADAAFDLVPGTISPVTRKENAPSKCFLLTLRDMKMPDKEALERCQAPYQLRKYENEISQQHRGIWLRRLLTEGWQVAKK